MPRIHITQDTFIKGIPVAAGENIECDEGVARQLRENHRAVPFDPFLHAPAAAEEPAAPVAQSAQADPAEAPGNPKPAPKPKR